MNVLRVRILLFAFAVATAHAAETNTSAPTGIASNAAPSSLTIDGYTYENVRWTRVTPSTVTFFHKTGVASLPLESLPLDLQKNFGYDPMKAAQYRQAEAKARAEWQQAKQRRDKLLQQQRAEADGRKKLEATAVDFHCTIMSLNEKGAVVRTRASVLIQHSDRVSAAEPINDGPVQTAIVYAFLVGHPRQASFGIGDTISCHAYRDGVQETNGEPLPRWVYVGEAHRRIPPPPP